MFETETELKQYMTAMNNCIMFLYVVLDVNVPTMFENLRTIVREEKDETAIFDYYYILKTGDCRRYLTVWWAELNLLRKNKGG